MMKTYKGMADMIRPGLRLTLNLLNSPRAILHSEILRLYSTASSTRKVRQLENIKDPSRFEDSPCGSLSDRIAAQSYIRPNNGLKVASFSFSTMSRKAGRIRLSVTFGCVGSLQRSKASRKRAKTALTNAGREARLV